MMTNEQRNNLKSIIEGYYASSTESEHDQSREVASHVYANALRDKKISALELRTHFEPLQRIASSAGVIENTTALARAIVQPIADGADGRAWVALAGTVVNLVNDPYANVESALSGVKAIGDSAMRLAEHSTEFISPEERQRLAIIYDFPHEKRIQALHGLALQDTAAMVSLGSLPGILPNAMTKVRVLANDASATLVKELDSLPKLYDPTPLPVLVGGSFGVDSELPQVLGMASKYPQSGGGSADEVKKFNMKDHEVPDPDYDNERIWYRQYYAAHVKNVEQSFLSVGLKEDAMLIQKQFDYMLNVKVTSNPAEYNIALNNAQQLVNKAQDTDYFKSVVQGSSTDDAIKHAHDLAREFGTVQKYIQYERDKRLIDLSKTEKAFEVQELARVNPDSVGYGRSVSPRSATERELHHHVYLTKLHESVEDLRSKLALLGLQDQADSLNARVHEMRQVTLEDSKSLHQQRVEDFMKLEEQAKQAQFVQPSRYNISPRYFEMIQQEIGANFSHIRDEVEHDREYHIRNQLWQRQSGDARRISDAEMVQKDRSALLGDSQSVSNIDEYGPEL